MILTHLEHNIVAGHHTMDNGLVFLGHCDPKFHDSLILPNIFNAVPGLQIRRSNKDNLGIIIQISS